MAVQQTLFEMHTGPLIRAAVFPITADELAGLKISYTRLDTAYGQLVVGCTHKGIAAALFIAEGEDPVALLLERFPKAVLANEATVFSRQVENFFSGNEPDELQLHVAGTDFQLKVWKALLEIPAGSISSYAGIAAGMGDANASRAVGNAVGANPIAVMIPCHRVVRVDGVIGKYRWGAERKQRILREETSVLFEREG